MTAAEAKRKLISNIQRSSEYSLVMSKINVAVSNNQVSIEVMNVKPALMLCLQHDGYAIFEKRNGIFLIKWADTTDISMKHG